MSNGVKWTPELERELCTPEEILENKLQVKLICSLIDARQKLDRQISRELNRLDTFKALQAE